MKDNVIHVLGFWVKQYEVPSFSGLKFTFDSTKIDFSNNIKTFDEAL